MLEQPDISNFKKFLRFMENKEFSGALNILYAVKHPALLKIFSRLSEKDVDMKLNETFIIDKDEIDLLLHYIHETRTKTSKYIISSLILFTALFLLLIASIWVAVIISPIFFCLTIILAIFMISGWYGMYIVFVYIRWEFTSPYYGFFEAHSKH